MKIKIFLLSLSLCLVASLNGQSYNVSSGNVCNAVFSPEYTFEGTPETPENVQVEVGWRYCGPWEGDWGHLDVDIWIDGQWVELLSINENGNGCGWTYDNITIPMATFNDAINSSGGNVLFNVDINDSCPGGVGCGSSGTCYNLTVNYDYAPNADFSVSETSICEGGFVSFVDESTGPQETHFWNFGEGASPATAEGNGPHTVSWDTAGLKDISLVVTGNGDESSTTKPGFVDVGPGPASVIFGDAFESWHESDYRDGGDVLMTIRNPTGGYYTIGNYPSNNYSWIQSWSEEGELLWAHNPYTSPGIGFTDAVCNDQGTIYLTGSYFNEMLVYSYFVNGDINFVSASESNTNVGNAITLGDDGSIYVVGDSDIQEAAAAKFGADGLVEYEVTISGMEDVTGTDVLFKDGYFYMLSWGRTTGINPDMHLSKYEPVLGIEEWTVDFNGSGFAIDEAHEMLAYGENIYIMGRSDQGVDDGWTVVEISTGGNQGWESDFLMGEASLDAHKRFDVDSDGNLYLASTVGSGAAAMMKLLKIDSDNGNLIWEHDFSGIGQTELKSIDVADNDQVFMFGRTLNNSGNWDLACVEVGQGPNEEWWAAYDGCGSNDDSAGGMVATPNHEVIISGSNSQIVNLRYGALVEPDASYELGSPAACAGAVVIFENTSVGSALSYDWNFGTGATPATATGAGPHEVIYSGPGVKNTTLNIENNLGTSDFQLDVIVNAAPTISVSADQDICIGQEVEITATGAGTITWDNDLGIGTNFDVMPVVSTIYKATLVDGNGCSAEDEVAVNVFTFPSVDAGDDITVCEGVEVTLSGSGEDDLSWDNDAGDGATPTVIAEETITYTLTASNAAGCDATDSMILTVNAAPDVSVDPDFSICVGESIELNATGADMYTWFPNETSGEQLSDTPAATTTYTVVGVAGNTCDAVASVTVTVNENPIASAGEDTEICSGMEQILLASGGATYVWEGIGVGASQTVMPAITTTYNVTVTNEFNCTDQASVMITVNETPNADAGLDQILCLGSEAILSGNGGGSYNWFDFGMIQNIVVSPENSTTYTLEVTAENGCSDQDEVQVNVVPLPNVNAGPDATVCMGSSVILYAVGGETYLWDNGLGEGQSQEVSPLLETTYIVTATDQFECSNMDTIIVSVNPLPAINAGPDQSICLGETATLSASGGDSYEWDNGAGSSSSVDVSPEVSTTYVVTGLDENECAGTDDILVEVHPVPELSISGITDEVYCVENTTPSVLVGEPAGGSFNGPGVSGFEFTPSVAGLGVHQITYEFEDEFGCLSTFSVEVTVDVCDLVEDLENLIEVYPIPTSGLLNIDWKGFEDLEVEDLTIFDAQGRAVAFNAQLQDKGFVVDLSSLSNGVYTLVVRQNNAILKRGVVVER